MFLFQVICNALWYITNQHTTINGAALRQKAVQPVPEVFDGFTGYNETKREKSDQLTAGQLKSHSEALYGLLLKPVLKSSAAWVKAHDDISRLFTFVYDLSGPSNSHSEYQSLLRTPSQNCSRTYYS